MSTWWKEAVIYQIYPRSFQDSDGDGIGDIPGIISRLDYLKTLGVDLIWLSPVYQSPNDDNGYDISDYQNIMKEFGTMADMEKLLAEAHARGIRIIMDLVVNHTSDEHEWFVESRKAEDNPYRDYYIWKEGKAEGEPPNNWGSCFSGPAWTYDENTGMYYLHLFSEKMPDLNWDNPEVRDAVYEMMDWWCQKGIDGFRMDVISLISKVPGFPDGELGDNGYAEFEPYCVHGPKVHNYLHEMHEKVLSRYDVMTVGETVGVTLEEAEKYAGYDRGELNMVFQFEHVEGDKKYGKWTDERVPLPRLKQILTKWQTGIYNKAWNSLFWSNHDQPRAVSRFGNDSEAYRVVSAKMLGTCLHMMQGTPYIYQGEELGMTNYPFEEVGQFKDIESVNAYEEWVGKGIVSHEEMMRCLRHKGRDNARTPMQWDDTEHAGFTDGTPWLAVNPNYPQINAAKAMADPDSVFCYYQKLIRLRREHPVIVYGEYELLLPEDEQLFVYRRKSEAEKLLVVCNFTDQQVEFELPDEFKGAQVKYLISNYPDLLYNGDRKLYPYEAFVIADHNQSR